jgi:hypothetical protein
MEKEIEEGLLIRATKTKTLVMFRGEEDFHPCLLKKTNLRIMSLGEYQIEGRLDSDGTLDIFWSKQIMGRIKNPETEEEVRTFWRDWFSDINFEAYPLPVVKKLWFKNKKYLPVATLNEVEKQWEVFLSIKDDERKMDLNWVKKVIYIWADKGGEGKSLTAREWASRDYPVEEWIQLAASTDHWQDRYGGQKCMILDDLRGNSANYGCLLNMLDPHSSNELAARYHNVTLGRCEEIIITSIKSPLELFNKDEIKESIYQLIRRISEFYKIVDGKLIPYYYDDKTGTLKEMGFPEPSSVPAPGTYPAHEMEIEILW